MSQNDIVDVFVVDSDSNSYSGCPTMKRSNISIQEALEHNGEEHLL